MNNIQKSIFGCVVPANSSSSDGSSAESMHCMAGFLDTLEVDITSCVEDGDALHSVFAESSMSSQGSDPSAEEATNHHAFPQERSAESSMSSQGSDLLAEILKILATPEYDDLANQVANIYAFSQKRPADSSSSIAGTSSQGSDSSLRKKIKRNDAGSSEAQQAQSKNADTAYFKRVCMRLDGRKLEINGKIIILGSKEIVFVKLLFEKINTYVPTDDLHVAIYGGELGDWNKDISQKRTRFYSLAYTLRKKLPEDCFKGKPSKGYMLSDFVMTSQNSGFSASSTLKLLTSKISAPNDSDSSEAFESEEDGGNLQKIQYDKKNYPLISDCYIDDYAQFIEDNKSTRRRYIKVRKSLGSVRIGEVYISFTKNKFMTDGGDVFLYPREIQALRFLALWYPNLVPYEQIYHNLSFGVVGNYGSDSEKPEIKKIYLMKLISNLQTRLKSGTDRIFISSNKGKGYSLVCHSKRQACPNESSVQDTLHSQSTDSSS